MSEKIWKADGKEIPESETYSENLDVALDAFLRPLKSLVDVAFRNEIEIRDEATPLQHAVLGLVGISKVLEEKDKVSQKESSDISIQLHHALVAISDHLLWLTDDLKNKIELEA